MLILDTVADASASLREIFTPRFRSALLNILAITLALLVVLGAALREALGLIGTPPYPWLTVVIAIVEGLGFLLASVFLVAPVSALVAGFFVDDLAAKVEQDLDPAGPVGTPLPIVRAVILSVRFALLSLAVLALALLLLLVPGLNGLVFLIANAYLAGRQYFEFAALRFRSEPEAAALRRANAGRIYAAGFCIALLLAVPLINLLAPLFGTALMVRVHRRVAALPPNRQRLAMRE